VFDADIKGAFDHIHQGKLLEKLHTYPAMKHAIQAWLKAGVMEGQDYSPTESGTPQGGVVSPLLMNIALHGMEQAITEGYSKSHAVEKPLVVRYADDVRHLTRYEILLAEKGGSEERDLRVISPTWTRKPKGKGACEKSRNRVKALKRCPARPA
jgi:retron-type reverse transcriptase